MIGQYYYQSKNGAGGRLRITPGFESFDRNFYRRGAVSGGEFAPPALLYDRGGGFYFVGREELVPDGDDVLTLRHGFLFPEELFADGKGTFGAKLYRFFDIADFDCTPEGFAREEAPPPVKRLRVAAGASDFLRPEDVFRRGREHSRFVRLLLYAAMMAVTDDFSLVFLIPPAKEESYHRQAALMVKSLFSLLPWELREELTFHTCVDDRDALGQTKISVTPLPKDRMPRSNRLFFFDFSRFKVSPDLIIEQKTRGTLTPYLLYQIWSNRDEKALSALFYIFHHNRALLRSAPLTETRIDALTCFFLLTEVGESYRADLGDELERISKGTAREIMLFLAGHVTNKDFLRLREMLDV